MAAFGVLPNWIKLWLACSTLICALDVAFTTLRPESLRDGKYGKYFTLWHLYAEVDTHYADATDALTRVTGSLMCVELVLNLVALLLACDLVYCPVHSLMAAFFSSALVFWKTTIYLCLFIVPDEDTYRSLAFDNASHITRNGIAPQTPPWKELLLFWIPNSVWMLVPLLAIVKLWAQIARGWAKQTHEATNTNGGKWQKAISSRKSVKTPFKSAKELKQMCALDELDPMETREKSQNAKNGDIVPTNILVGHR